MHSDHVFPSVAGELLLSAPPSIATSSCIAATVLENEEMMENGIDEHIEADTEAGFQMVGGRKRHQSHRRLDKGSSEEEEASDRDTKKVRNKANTEQAIQGPAEAGTTATSQPRGSSAETTTTRAGTSPSKMTRLLFPNECRLSCHEKLLWTVKLGRAFRRFEPILKEGRHRAYVTVGSQEAADVLTTTGFEDVVLKRPEAMEKLTKVIFFRYPQVLDPEYLLDDPRFVWAHRHVMRGEERSQVIALIKGEVPDSVFITGAGYRKLVPYVEEPSFCLRCKRWGHRAWQCQEDTRCRFCARKHPSSLCGEKIKAGTRVEPRCCNCGGEHNAQSILCLRRPDYGRRSD